jgi:hypothetical protein
MDINFNLDFKDCEVVFDNRQIYFKWKDERDILFKINDVINISFLFTNFEQSTAIDTSDLLDDLIQMPNSRTFAKLNETTRVFFNCDRIDRNSGRTSPKTRYYNNAKSYYNITEIGINFKDIMSLITFLKIGEDNWRNHEYFFFLRQHQKEEETSGGLRRAQSF